MGIIEKIFWPQKVEKISSDDLIKRLKEELRLRISTEAFSCEPYVHDYGVGGMRIDAAGSMNADCSLDDKAVSVSYGRKLHDHTKESSWFAFIGKPVGRDLPEAESKLIEAAYAERNYKGREFIELIEKHLAEAGWLKPTR